MVIKGGSAASIRRRPGLLLFRIGDKLGSGDRDVIWSAACVRLVWSLSFAIGWDLLLSRLVSLVEAAVDSISRLPCLTRSFMVALDLHFPSHHRSDGADGRSAGIVRCGGRAAALAFAASSNVWSCTSVWACGSCSGLPVPRLPVVVRRHGGRRRCAPEEWVCTVLHFAI